MVTCRADGQRKHLAASSSEPQQALKGNRVSHLLGHNMSLSLTLSNRLAFTFVVAFKPLFLKASSQPLIWIPHWTPVAEMPCGKEDSRNGSSTEEDWLLLGICHMLDRFLTPPRAFWHVFAHAHYKKNACVENSVGAGTWSLPNPLTLIQKYPSPHVVPIFLILFLEAGKATINYVHNTLTWTVSRGVAEGEDGLLEHWSESANLQTCSYVAK